MLLCTPIFRVYFFTFFSLHKTLVFILVTVYGWIDGYSLHFFINNVCLVDNIRRTIGYRCACPHKIIFGVSSSSKGPRISRGCLIYHWKYVRCSDLKFICPGLLIVFVVIFPSSWDCSDLSHSILGLLLLSCCQLIMKSQGVVWLWASILSGGLVLLTYLP